MIACVIYTRFSPRKNAKDCDSCDSQEQICRDYARGRGWVVKSAHRDEGVSGAEVDRPGLEAALADLDQGDVLLVYRRDRLARNLYLAEFIRRRVKRSGASITATAGDIEGDGNSPEVIMVRQIMDAVHEYERKVIAARTKALMRSKQKRGQRMGRFAPYGFSIDPDDPRGLVENPKEQAAITRARELMVEGLNDHAIARRLDQEHPEAARGKRWASRSIGRLRKRI